MAKLICTAAIVTLLLFASACSATGGRSADNRLLRKGPRRGPAESTTPAPTDKAPTEQWTYTLPTPQLVMNPLVLDWDDTVLVPTNTTLLAFNITSGALFWQFDVPSGDTGGYVTGDTFNVYLGTTKSVYALDRKTGKQLWAYALPSGRADPTVHARVDLGGDDFLFVTTWSTPLIALSASNGTQRYTGSSKYNAEMHSHPLFDRLFYYGVDATSGVGSVVATDKWTGKTLWTIDNVTNFELTTRLDRPVIVLLRVLTDTTSRLDVYDAWGDDPSKKPTLWNRTFNCYQGYIDYVSVEGRVFTGTSVNNEPVGDTVSAVDMVTGDIKWQATSGLNNMLAGAGGVFTFGTSATGTQAFDAYTGKLLWTFTKGVASNAGAAARNTVVFGTETQVVALRIHDW